MALLRKLFGTDFTLTEEETKRVTDYVMEKRKSSTDDIKLSRVKIKVPILGEVDHCERSMVVVETIYTHTGCCEHSKSNEWLGENEIVCPCCLHSFNRSYV